MKDLPYRPNVCLLILNHANLLFLGERLGYPGVWQFPQGGVEPQQSLADNAVREACEELGIEANLIVVERQLDTTHQYDFQKPPDYAVDRWRGQAQTFWVLRFLGEDKDINLARYHQELSAYRWCTPEEALKLAEAKRRPGYKKALTEMSSIYFKVL